MNSYLQHLKKHLFIYSYCVLVLLVNFAGLIWAINPDSIGAYIIYFICIPLNLALILVGISYLIYHKFRKKTLPYITYLFIILFVPFTSIVWLYYLIVVYYNYGAC